MLRLIQPRQDKNGKQILAFVGETDDEYYERARQWIEERDRMAADVFSRVLDERPKIVPLADGNGDGVELTCISHTEHGLSDEQIMKLTQYCPFCGGLLSRPISSSGDNDQNPIRCHYRDDD